MLKVGLTGGIGSGKSTVAQALSKQGFVIVDADQIARDIVEPGEPALVELAREFGEGVINSDGTLNRGELARLAFSNARRTEMLNSITHPRITAETQRRFDLAEQQGEPAVIYDMPLLIDLGKHHDMDFVVVVSAEQEVRIERLQHSRGIDPEDAQRRIAAQIDESQRRAAADFIIDNNGSLADLRPQIDELIAKLRILVAAERSSES